VGRELSLVAVKERDCQAFKENAKFPAAISMLTKPLNGHPISSSNFHHLRRHPTTLDHKEEEGKQGTTDICNAISSSARYNSQSIRQQQQQQREQRNYILFVPFAVQSTPPTALSQLVTCVQSN
jgi:hypothetical protein